jgi:hypothetical protein
MQHEFTRAQQRLREEVEQVRSGTRGLLLPLFTWPLAWDALFEVMRGGTSGLVAALIGMGLPVLAVRFLRRGHRGDTNRAAIITGFATGVVSLLGADHGPVIAALLGSGAWAGTRLLYDGAVAEVEPPPPPAPAADPGPLDAARARLARIQGVTARLADPRIQGVTGAMASVLDDLEARPDRLPQARRFLAVHLDGLERITDRLAAGATPPEGLPALLEDLRGAAEDLRGKLRAEESEALEIQVKVLSDRLRQEGYA